MTISLDPPLTPDIIEFLLMRISPGAQLQSFTLLAGSFSNETSLIIATTAVGRELKLVVRRYAVFGSYDRGEKAEREFKKWSGAQVRQNFSDFISGSIRRLAIEKR